MKRFGKIAIGALMLAGSAVGATVATTAPADAHVSVGIGIGVPGPAYVAPGPGYYGNACYDARFRYYHPGRCAGWRAAYGPAYYGYYDSGFWGPGYYEPVAGGFWFTDSWGHRRWHAGEFHGGGFHGHATWHSGGWHHH